MKSLEILFTRMLLLFNVELALAAHSNEERTGNRLKDSQQPVTPQSSSSVEQDGTLSHTQHESLSDPNVRTKSSHDDNHESSNEHPSDPYDEPLPDRPIQLLRPDPTHHRRLEVVERNIKHLHRINTAVAVVAVVGKFHSGKSFLLNQLMGKKNGFGVGPSVRPQTMGIWMWGKVRET